MVTVSKCKIRGFSSVNIFLKSSTSKSSKLLINDRANFPSDSKYTWQTITTSTLICQTSVKNVLGNILSFISIVWDEILTPTTVAIFIDSVRHWYRFYLYQIKNNFISQNGVINLWSWSAQAKIVWNRIHHSLDITGFSIDFPSDTKIHPWKPHTFLDTVAF